MSELWKLNITDYSLTELKQLFNLKDPYTMEDIINADNILHQKIINDQSIDAQKKRQILVFLKHAKEKLIKSKKKELEGFVKSNLFTGDQHMVQNLSNIREDYIHETDIQDKKGVAKQVYKKVLAINTLFRDDYYKTLATDYSLTLPTKVNNVISMQLSGFEFPNTYFQITKEWGNDFFWMGWQRDINIATLNWYYIQIPEGTYRREDMQDEINTQIQIATGLPPQQCPQCSIDKKSNRTVFALPTTSPTNAFFELHFNRTRGKYTTTEPNQSNDSHPELDTQPPPANIAENFGWIIGYRLAEYKASSAYVSEGVYDSWGTKYLYVIVDDFNKNFSNTIDPVYHASLGAENILARVTLAPILNSLTEGTALADQFNPGETKRNYYGPVDVERLKIKITDEFGRVININNMDLSLALEFTCLYS